MSSSSSSSSHHDIKTCKCQSCEIEKINIRREKDKIYRRIKRRSDCKNPADDCQCEFHVKYRDIKEKDALAHSKRRESLTPDEKSKIDSTDRKQKQKVRRVILSPEQKENLSNTRATDLHEKLLHEYESAVKTVFNRQELDDLDRNFDFCKYAGKNFLLFLII
jgi:hypothetical protein